MIITIGNTGTAVLRYSGMEVTVATLKVLCSQSSSRNTKLLFGLFFNDIKNQMVIRERLYMYFSWADSTNCYFTITNTEIMQVCDDIVLTPKFNTQLFKTLSQILLLNYR
jgi:hypothetical protein